VGTKNSYSIVVPGYTPTIVTRREVACHLCGECKWSRGTQRVIAVWGDATSVVDQVSGPDDHRFEWTCEFCGSTARREVVLLLDTLAKPDRRSEMSKKPERRHTVPNPDGGWDVEKPHAERASGHFDTQREAQARGREILRNKGGGENVTHSRAGRIRESDSTRGQS
jgi:hypothetical protein